MKTLIEVIQNRGFLYLVLLALHIFPIEFENSSLSNGKTLPLAGLLFSLHFIVFFLNHIFLLGIRMTHLVYIPFTSNICQKKLMFIFEFFRSWCMIFSWVFLSSVVFY